MRNFILASLLLIAAVSYAGITEYTFTSVNWASRVGSTTCDGVSDGWTCDKAASDMGTARYDAAGALMYAGVGVKTGTSGAGATSVVSFTNVRSLTVNFCQNSSKGKGVIYVQVGNTPYDSLIVNKPATSGSGVYNRDSVIRVTGSPSGPVRFWIKCTENGIYLNTLAIRADEGGSSPFTMATYQMVTDVAQLQDSDQIIIGVPSAGKIMGYYDELVSQNNIHAIRGQFTADGSQVDEDERAVYTLRRSSIGDTLSCWYIQDEIRYEEAYLVASGGQTKNRLALWDHLYDEGTYGNYGYWNISLAADGDATIENLGNSRGKYLQYNAQNNPTLFACYPTQGSQTPVKIYRRVEAIGNIPAIVAPLLNFGTVVMDANQSSKQASVMVNTNMLTQDIRVSCDNPIFTVVDTLLDRDGGMLRVMLNATQLGKHTATLTLTSDTVVATISVLANVVGKMKIAEVAQQPDYAICYLDTVQVTKKYDTYIFIRDATGSMLIYDNGDGTGKRYGEGLKSGDKLTGVVGRFQNYFGVPELVPTEHFSSRSDSAAVPEVHATIDSALVCHLVELDNVTIGADDHLTWGGASLPVVDKFNVGITQNVQEDIVAVVMISWDEVVLWLVSEDPHTALESTGVERRVRKVIEDGQVIIIDGDKRYTILGVER